MGDQCSDRGRHQKMQREVEDAERSFIVRMLIRVHGEMLVGPVAMVGKCRRCEVNN